MGEPKQNLRLGSETQLQRTVRLLDRVCSRTVVLGPRPERPAETHSARNPLDFYTDIIPDRGPLGGLYTGLALTKTEYNLFLGCDTPLVPAALLRFVARRALQSHAGATVCRSADGRLQRLAAVYRRRIRGAVRASLALGLNQLSSIYPRIHCEVIGWNELARAGFSAIVFTNVNTPADYLAVRGRFKQ